MMDNKQNLSEYPAEYSKLILTDTGQVMRLSSEIKSLLVLDKVKRFPPGKK